MGKDVPWDLKIIQDLGPLNKIVTSAIDEVKRYKAKTLLPSSSCLKRDDISMSLPISRSHEKASPWRIFHKWKICL
jgi:hypothetical protein